MTTIYLIRHAEAEGNLYRIAQGQYDSGLTERGWRQVRALEERFRGVHIDAAYSSDLYRTCATASAICRPRGMTVQRRKGLREICVGDWEKRTWGEIARRWPKEMEDFSLHMERWAIPGAETPGEVLERVRRTVEDIAGENPGRTVAVFSHGYAIRLLLANLQGISLADTGTKSPTGDNTSVALLEAEDGKLRVVYQNDNRHLLSEAFLAGEKVRKRAVALEPGLWFRSIGETEGLPAGLEGSGYAPGEGAALAGFLGEDPAGLLQLRPETGEIVRVYIREELRKRGFGVQLIGQAVQMCRDRGCDALTIQDPGAWRDFFLDSGFAPDASGGLRKSIALEAEFLGKS